MSDELKPVLTQFPDDKRIDPVVCEALDKMIRDGSDLNQIQREAVLSVVQSCIDMSLAPPPALESFFAHVYTEWSEEAKASDDGKRRLTGLVRLLKANGAAAQSVARLVQEVTQKREARRQDMLRLAEHMAASVDAPQQRGKKEQARPPAKVYVRRMQTARMGVGDQPVANLNLAVTIADEAVEAYPSTPMVLLEAAGCHQILAEKGQKLSSTERYVHLREASTLYQRCYDVVTGKPYSELKGDYERMRNDLPPLIVKIQKELDKLEEKQK